MQHDELASTLAKVAEELAGERDEAVTATRICELAVEVVESCDHASVALRSRRAGLRTVAASSDLAERVDALQHELGEGPLLSVAGTAEVCRSNDAAADLRWPAWGEAAAGIGIRSLASVLLIAGPHSLGAITFYSHRRNAWDKRDYDLAQLFATHAALGLDAAQVISGLRAALDNRHRIGVAQGILMQRHGLTLEQSFGVLQRFSNDSNVKLSDVAADIVRDLDHS
jgi:GAF domain-containing protein